MSDLIQGKVVSIAERTAEAFIKLATPADVRRLQNLRDEVIINQAAKLPTTLSDNTVIQALFGAYTSGDAIYVLHGGKYVPVGVLTGVQFPPPNFLDISLAGADEPTYVQGIQRAPTFSGRVVIR